MDEKSKKHLFFLTGELSGDMHAGELVKEILRHRPGWRITAMGSDGLRHAGAEIWYDSLKLGAIGVFEAAKRILPFYKIRRKFISELSKINPDLVIAVDFRAFNILLLHEANKQGYHAAYYIAPVQWGRPGKTRERRAFEATLDAARKRSRKVRDQTRDRFHAIADVCDVVILIYPICENEYREAGANVHYVGHPLVNIIERKLKSLRADFQRAEELAEIKSGSKLIGVLPGSRLHEFKHHCGPIREAVRLIRDAYPEAKFFIPLSNPRLMPDLEQYWPGVRSECKIIAHDEYDWLAGADLLLAKSGTAVQAGMILGVPMVAFYKIVSEGLYKLSKALFMERKLWTFPNILADKEVIPEFIQSKFTGENVAKAAIELLGDREKCSLMRDELLALRGLLYRENCLEHAAKLIIEAAENAHH